MKTNEKHTAGPLSPAQDDNGDWLIVRRRGTADCTDITIPGTLTEAECVLLASAPALLAERDALRRALEECVFTIDQYVQYADAMTKRGMGHEPMSRSGFSPEYLLAHVRAALAQGEKGGSR